MKYIFLIILTILAYCKKESKKDLIKNYTELIGENFIGEIFFYKDDVVMYEKSEVSPIVKKFKKTDIVKIIETRIKNSKYPDSMFYKVYFENQFGYIPTDSEIKKDMFAFLYSNVQGKIKASSLRLRETPDLNGKVITSIPKAEIVDIIWQGEYYQEIDDKYDTWFKIKTKEGKIGYSYAGYISKNLNIDLNSFDDIADSIYGYIEIIKPPIYYSRYKTKVTSDYSTPCGKNDLSYLPKEGSFVKVEQIAIINNEKFYLVIGSTDEFNGCYSGYKGWVSEDDVMFIQDIYEYTYQKYGSKFDKKFLDVINKSIGGELNVTYLVIEDFEVNLNEKYKFFKVFSDYIFYLNEDNYYFAGQILGNAVDINQDGIDEIVNPSGASCCQCQPASISIWNGKEFKKIYSESGGGYGISLEFNDKIIIEKITGYETNNSFDSNAKLITKTNYYEIKNLQLVPTKKRPK